MNITVEKSQRFLGTTTVNELQHRNNMNIQYYKILNNNRHMAVISRMEIPHGVHNIVTIESQKLPLWKQDMQIRMGRRPKPTETRKILRVEEITPEEASKYRLEVYEARF